MEQLQHDLLPFLIVTSSQVRVGMPLPLLLCCISGLGAEGLRHRHNAMAYDRMVQLSASLASAAAAAGESKQQRAPPAPVPPLSQCADSPLGCSPSHYEALLDDVSGLLYDCARQGKVNNIRFILDAWSRQRLHLACTNGHAGLMRLLLSCGTTNIVSNGSGNPGSTSLR